MGFKMMPGSRDHGLKTGTGFASRGLVNPDVAPKTHDGTSNPHTDAKSGDELPSYTIKSADHTASGGGSSEATTKTTYKPPTKTPEGDAAYAALSPAARQAQDDKYRKLNTKTVTTPPSSTASTKIKSETKTIGDKTLNQIKTDATLAQEGAISKKEAEAKHETNLRTKDSSAYAQKLYRLKSKYSPTEIDASKIQASADRYAGSMAEKRLSDSRFGMPVGEKESNLIKEQIKNNVSQTPRIQ